MACNITLLGYNPGETYTVDSSNTAAGLATAKKYLTGDSSIQNTKAKGLYITVEKNEIRHTWGSTPTTSLGHLLGVGDHLILDSWKQVDDFKFISAVAGLHATLMITVLF